MARIQKQDANALHAGSPQTAEVVIRGAILAISCAISYWLITHILANTYSVSRDDDLLGGMWAVVATIFVYRYSHAESVRAASSRMAATSVSFVLCLIYLLIFPFHVWGMAALIGIGAIVVTTMGRPDDTITTGITIAVVMVVAALSPHDAWRQPILRLVDTAVGVVVGVAAVWLGANAMRVTKLIGRDNPPKSDAGERA
jgi:Fusaric acid resistance protein-like